MDPKLRTATTNFCVCSLLLCAVIATVSEALVSKSVLGALSDKLSYLISLVCLGPGSLYHILGRLYVSVLCCFLHSVVISLSYWVISGEDSNHLILCSGAAVGSEEEVPLGNQRPIADMLSELASKRYVISV